MNIYTLIQDICLSTRLCVVCLADDVREMFAVYEASVIKLLLLTHLWVHLCNKYVLTIQNCLFMTAYKNRVAHRKRCRSFSLFLFLFHSLWRMMKHWRLWRKSVGKNGNAKPSVKWREKVKKKMEKQQLVLKWTHQHIVNAVFAQVQVAIKIEANEMGTIAAMLFQQNLMRGWFGVGFLFWFQMLFFVTN